MARKIPRLNRASPVRSPKPRVILFTEGELTENIYFVGFARQSNNFLISVQNEHGVPETLLKSAKRFKKFEERRFDSYSKGDLVYIVFDRDEHKNIESVIQEAKDADIGIAYSNPCFELWLLLHLQDHDAPDDRHKVQEKLERVLKAYKRDKKVFDFKDVESRIDDACSRADAMSKRRQNEGAARENPYTDVHLLIEKIRKLYAANAVQ